MKTRLLLVLVLLAIALPAPTVAEAADLSTAKVVLIAGPVGGSNSHYGSDIDALASRARLYATDVTVFKTPNAQWSKVKPALAGASLVIYIGHGYGFPSRYTSTLAPDRQDGFGLDPETGADGTKVAYYGENAIDDVMLAPNAAIYLFHLCYASGETEPGLSAGTLGDVKVRVANYASGFIRAGAGAVIADAWHPQAGYVDSLFTKSIDMPTLFRSGAYHGNPIAYDSVRNPGFSIILDPTEPGKYFYHSIVYAPSLTTNTILAGAVSTDIHPPDFVVPGAAEAIAPTILYGDAALTTPKATLGAGARLRLTSRATNAPDGVRVFGGYPLGASGTTGYLRADTIAPRDSYPPRVVGETAPAALVTPNGDGADDALTIGMRVTEPLTWTLVAKNAAGMSVDQVRTSGSDLAVSAAMRGADGAAFAEGAYTYSLVGTDGWGNRAIKRAGSFVLDGTPPTTTATAVGTPAEGGWYRSDVSIAVSALDRGTGVATIECILDGTALSPCPATLTLSAEGSHLLTYGARDRANNAEPPRTLVVGIDRTPPVASLEFAGPAGDDGWFTGPVLVDAITSDTASGVLSTTLVGLAPTPAPLAGTTLVERDGRYALTLVVRDAAGFTTTVARELKIDALSPTFAPPAPWGGSAFSPNGDGDRDAIGIVTGIAETATVTARIADAQGVPVRTATQLLAPGARLVWDGRRDDGSVAADGEYTALLDARDPAGNTASWPDPIGLRIETATITASSIGPAAFYGDGDRLAPQTVYSVTLATPATVRLEMVAAASGTSVYTSSGSLPAGTKTYTWKGRTRDGALVPPGRYAIRLTATTEMGIAVSERYVEMTPFLLVKPPTSLVRGRVSTLTVRSVEPLGAVPTLTVGATKIAGVYVSPSTYRFRFTTPASAGSTLSFSIAGRDVGGGTNVLRTKLPVR